MSTRFIIFRNDILGQGTFGVVYRAIDNETGEYVAVKETLYKNAESLSTESICSAAPYEVTGEEVEESLFGGTAGDGTGPVALDAMLKHEYELLMKLAHSNIVRVIAFNDKVAVAAMSVADQSFGSPALPSNAPGLSSSAPADFSHHVSQIFMDWMPAGSIQSVLKKMGFRLHEGIVRRYFRDCLRGLAYLHEQGVLHRDIKPGNILVSGTGEARLSDFGTSKQLLRAGGAGGTMSASPSVVYCENNDNDTDDNEASQALLGCTGSAMVGSPCYLAREIVTNAQYSAGSDVWALACAVTEMATGKVPWSHLGGRILHEPYALIFHIGTAEPPDHHPAIPTHLSSKLRELLTAMFDVDPKARPRAKELLAEPYFTAASLPDDAETHDTYALALESVRRAHIEKEWRKQQQQQNSGDPLNSEPYHQGVINTTSSIGEEEGRSVSESGTSDSLLPLNNNASGNRSNGRSSLAPRMHTDASFGAARRGSPQPSSTSSVQSPQEDKASVPAHAHNADRSESQMIPMGPSSMTAGSSSVGDLELEVVRQVSQLTLEPHQLTLEAATKRHHRLEAEAEANCNTKKTNTTADNEANDDDYGGGDATATIANRKATSQRQAAFSKAMAPKVRQAKACDESLGSANATVPTGFTQPTTATMPAQPHEEATVDPTATLAANPTRRPNNKRRAVQYLDLRWKYFPIRPASLVIQAFDNGEPSVRLQSGHGGSYDIDLRAMTQTNVVTKKVRSIRIVEEEHQQPTQQHRRHHPATAQHQGAPQRR